MIPSLSPAAEFRLVRLIRLALRGTVPPSSRNHAFQQVAALAAARVATLALPMLDRHDRGELIATAHIRNALLGDRTVGNWSMEMRTMPDFHRRLERQASWRDARQADAFSSLIGRYAQTSGEPEIEYAFRALSASLVHLATASDRRAGEILVRDAQGLLLTLRIRRAGVFDRMTADVRRLFRRLGLAGSTVFRLHYRVAYSP
jgi:hypothetical protein